MQSLFCFALGVMAFAMISTTANAATYRIHKGHDAHRAVLKHHRPYAALPTSRHADHHGSMVGMASYYGNEFWIAIRVGCTHQPECYDGGPSFPSVWHQGARNKQEQRPLRGGYH